MKKKLYYIANIRIPTEKAHGIQIMNMCEAFAEQGFDVELVVPRRRNVIASDPFEYYGVKKNFSIRRLWCIDAIEFGAIGFWIQAISFAKMAVLFSFFKNGYFYTRDEVDAFYLSLFGKQVTWEVHVEKNNFFSRVALKFGVRIVVITTGLRKLYEGFGVPAERILVAHDAVNTQLFTDLPDKSVLRLELGLPEDRTVISYIGKYRTMGETKGVADIIEPFVRLREKYPRAYLLVVGPERDEIIELAELLQSQGVSDGDFAIVGHVSHKEAIRYMKASDLLLMMYPNTRHYAHFMSPLKLFEYMASGTPILASDLPSIREVIDERSAFLFTPDDTEDLKKKLINFLENREEGNIKADVSLHLAQMYTWQERARRIAVFFH